jgi:hypothetical protein
LSRRAALAALNVALSLAGESDSASVRIGLVDVDHPATQALRSRSPETLHEVLVTDLVDGEQEWVKDWRDLLMVLAPFHHCARELGLDSAAVFREAAEEGPASLRDVVIEFGRRTDITPSEWRFRVVSEEQGPAYRCI